MRLPVSTAVMPAVAAVAAVDGDDDGDEDGDDDGDDDGGVSPFPPFVEEATSRAEFSLSFMFLFLSQQSS